MEKINRNGLCPCGSGKKYKKCCLSKPKSHKGGVSLRPLYAYVLLAVIFIIALIVRISPVVQSPETLKYGLGPYGDSYLYQVIAYNLYKGNGFSGTDQGQAFGSGMDGAKLTYEPVIERAPVYPYFMSMIYGAFCDPVDMASLQLWHKNWDKVRIVQCLLDAIICFFVFFITRAISKDSFIPALVSSGLYCFSFYNIFYTRALLGETVTTFLLTASLLFCILGIRHDKLYLWGLAGAVFGLVILTRPQYILFPGMLLFYMVLINRGHILNTVMKVFVFMIVAAVVVAPWSIRNYHIFKKFIPVSVGGIGQALFEGTYETNDNWTGWDGFPDSAFDSQEEKAAAQSLFNAYVSSSYTGGIKIKDTDNALKEMAIKRIRKHPFECLKCWVTRIPRLWYQFYIPMYRDREASGGFFVFYFIFAACALWKGTREERILTAPVWLLFIYLTLIFFPLHIEPRYGVPLMPGIICMTSIGVWRIFSYVKY